MGASVLLFRSFFIFWVRLGSRFRGLRFNFSYDNICTQLAATDVIELKSG